MRRLAPLLVGLLAFVAFLPALHGQFLAWDDDVNLVTNEHFRGLGWPQVRWAFSNVRMGHYIPITWLSFSGTRPTPSPSTSWPGDSWPPPATGDARRGEPIRP